MEYSIFSDPVYYVPPYNVNHNQFSNIFIDANKNIIKYSKYDNCYDLSYKKISEDFTVTDPTAFLNTIFFDKKIIAITHWPPSYGHVLESIFHLFEAYENEIYKDYYIFIFIPLANKNLLLLCKFLFGNRFINPLDYSQDSLFSFKNVLLIKNYPNTKNWHKWDNDNLKNIVRNYYNDDSVISHDRVFLTRGINSPHDKWSCLENLIEVEKFYKDNNFIILNPELISDINLYNLIKNARVLITTNGSALCPLIFLNNINCKIFCLNSQRYLPEWRRNLKNFEDVQNTLNINPNLINDDFEKNLWSPITSNFDFTYIDSFDNIITNDQLIKTISNLYC